MPVYYHGGAAIAEFREIDKFTSPEDWVGSLTTFPHHLQAEDIHGSYGVSPTSEGNLLDLVSGAPDAWLGSKRAPSDHALLVKLLDAGERLPAHWHPPREFAQRHLGSPVGKAEAWIALNEQPAELWLGLRAEVTAADVREAIRDQAPDGFLALMNATTLRRGDVVFVPPGVIHALGAGSLVLELQEPTTMSVLAEYAKTGLSSDHAALGLDWDLAQSSLEFDVARNDPERLIDRGRALVDGVAELLPAEASHYFECASVRRATGHVDIHSMAVLVGAEGEATIDTGDSTIVVRKGETWLIPASAGRIAVEARGQVFFCQPPRP